MPKSIHDLGEWLTEHGLGQYTASFIDHNIDYTLLSELTEADLERIGMSLGHRKSFLRALRAEVSGRDSGHGVAALHAASVAAAAPYREAEHRHITVMFCDLVDSTKLSETMEPEDLQVLLASYREACSTAIRRYGGWVARYMGDGVMAFFGWPRAHEDDAIRAVHAGLEAISAISGIAGPAQLAARVGVSSGPVVVGEVGAGDDSSVDAVGETPNIAARLQAMAAPNAIVISEATRKLLAGAFEYQDIGRHVLKGITRRIQVYRVLGAKSVDSRFDAAHPETLTPLVGRSTELNMLFDRWAKSKEGDGQVILLSGMPGVGKSRLIHELKVQLQSEPHFLFNHQCSPYHTQSAFFPVIEQIERSAQLLPRESASDKLRKLQAYLPGTVGDDPDTLALVANLVSISGDQQNQLASLTPQQIKNRTVTALVDILLGFSAEHPTLCIFEDVHWIDPSTWELLELAIGRVDRARILLIVSYRPEFRPNWLTRSNVTVHSLTRLSRSEVAGMVEAIALRESVPLQPVMNQIIEKADGLPLYIEELTNSILSAMRSQPSADGAGYANPAAILRVPDTLSDALMERLDRVPQGRRLAQTAAVIGRDFSHELLALALPVDENSLHLTLARLEEADIIYRSGGSPHPLYAFKHALMRDAIYNSLLKSSRRQMHSEIAEILESRFSGIVETQPELLAHHFSEAGNYLKAVRFWHLSGQRATARSANVEAISHFRRALDALAGCPDTSDRTAQEISLHLALGIPMIAVRGYAAEETREVFARARSLCLQLNKPGEYFQALYGLWGHAWMSGNNDQALSMAKEFLIRAEGTSDAVPLMVGHRVMGSTLLSIGEFEQSRQHLEMSIELSQRKDRQSLYSRYMVEPQTASLLLLSWDLWILGYPEQALSRVSKALELSRQLDQPYSIAFAHYMTSVVHLLRGEPRAALASAETSFEISREQRFSLYVLLSRVSRGYARGGLGETELARSEIRLGLAEMRKAGVRYMLPMMDEWLADMTARSGDREAALSIIERALVGLDEVTGRSWEAELHRQRAQILATLGAARAAEAEASFKKAVQIAERQGARSFVLRAASGLAALLHSQGRSEEARRWIAPVYEGFREGYDTEDLTRARGLLTALSAQDNRCNGRNVSVRE
ncbi:AAA family ATPase [Pseudorhodoplanes sp.]|uniref:AAA family ATPase n=1 Tax=Pseudorhodoplanes sp. TaxID=1934341 RepID=UPI00391CD1EE